MKGLKGHCPYCGQSLKGSRSSRDHIFPRKLGGTNAKVNIVITHVKCNNYKSDYTPEDFLKHVKDYVENYVEGGRIYKYKLFLVYLPVFMESEKYRVAKAYFEYRQNWPYD